MVAPGGLLAFSVHDEFHNTLDAEWQDGFAFIAASEVSVGRPCVYWTVVPVPAAASMPCNGVTLNVEVT